MSTPELVELPHRVTIVQRQKIAMADIPASMGKMLPAVFAYMEQNDMLPAGPPMSRWLDMGDPIHMESGIPVAGSFGDVEDPFTISELPGGRCAVLLHVGPYDKMGESWQAMFAWLRSQELAPQASWEEYLTDPGQEPDSSKWQTKICVKVAG